MNTSKKRNALLKAYDGYSWHERVANMPEDQVIAVYLRFERDGWPNKEPKLNPDVTKPEAPPKPPDDEQLGLF